MGIKGLWEKFKDADPGRTVPLATLADEFFAEKKRPLRIAVDTPLPLLEFKAVTSGAEEEKWGGLNHIVRDFYFHVGHLLAAGVEPILVFDGPGVGWYTPLRENPGGKLSHQFPSLAKTIENKPNFPSSTIANHYLHPKVSTDLNVPRIDWTKKLQIQDLRKFTRTFFDWRYQLFAGKFVRLLALAALSRALLLHGNERTDGSALIETITRSKEEDGVRQLRVAFIPANVVPFDIAGEPENPHFGGNIKNLFDSSLPVTEWVPFWLVEYGAPEAFHRWQEREESRTKGTKRKTPPDDSAPRRGPGRPRKNETTPQEQSRTSVTVEPAPKRSRGRPRKDNSLPQQKQNTFIDLTSDSK
ncbi:hypothetical protein V8F06_014623 [Rhypophila decipiens]